MSVKRRKPGESQFSIIRHLECKVRYLESWWRRGEIPPPSMVSTIVFFALILLSGFSMLVILILSYFEVRFTEIELDKPKFAFVACSMFASGFYVTWISLCCWRRVSGYDWWMIPHRSWSYHDCLSLLACFFTYAISYV